MEMQSVEIPEFPRLRSKEAIEALYDFVNELEEQKGKELTRARIHEDGGLWRLSK